MRIIFFKIRHFVRLLFRLFLSVPFITVSIFGNFIVFVFATIIYFLERDINPNITSYLDAVWWSFATTSTIGYGDVVPVSAAGKVFGILLMLIGVGIFGIYTALFARAIIDDEVYME